MIHWIVAVIFCLAIIIIYVAYMNYSQIESFDEPQPQTQELVPEVKFPFKNIRDENGKLLNIILISAPFRAEEDEKKYAEYKEQGLSFCGISSYSEFPDKLLNPFDSRFHEERGHDYLSMVDAWVHCFRQPSASMASGKPLLMMSEADLKDCNGYYKPDPDINKEYDFIYICLDDEGDKCEPGWQSYIRSWDMAKKCLEVMCEQFKLRGVIVGRTKCEFTDKCNGIVKVLPFLDFHEFQKEIQKCRFIFVPNVSDASPRVITESLCYNLPALVNYNIVGGWHNIIPGVTGEFFTNETDVSVAINRILTNYDSYRAREWYCKNRGKEISGGIFARFLEDNFPNINQRNMKYITI